MNKYEFDETYFDDKVTNWWIYPAEQGYVLDRNKQPIKHKITLRVGKRMDRYGGEGGNFLSVPGTKYAARSLPPSNLSGPQGEPVRTTGRTCPDHRDRNSTATTTCMR
ncbi:glycohydrolase toxin TNT-related protein [Gordonia sp. ABSL11-1]|uniref:glycohydrolase toxin TNT-related protein n=1 Tax=Gordonia sp. ABSL11-1 TaxID=3053924 RepID=UPI0025747AD3|nr:glycohydrolase toxin TNT-related protein [Gordonia sp. ABSL11-1]MDL9944107.1 glycohydrolase toxin TNT-related protein [Gordonia sp. ABSL11-1]